MITSWADYIGTRGTRSKAWLIEQGIKAEKIFINPNVFDFEEFKPITVKKEYDLVYVGLLKEYKRVDLLIDIVEILVKFY
jgi:glycosyltransferase involved in cell wall biosynthesis